MNLALFPPVEKSWLDCYLVSMTILDITLFRRLEKLVANFLKNFNFGVEDERTMLPGVSEKIVASTCTRVCK